MHGDTYYDLRQTRHVEIPDAVKRIYTVVENHLRSALLLTPILLNQLGSASTQQITVVRYD